MDVVCVVGYRSLRRADHSSREVQPSVVCLSVIVNPRKKGGPITLGAVAVWKKNIMAQKNIGSIMVSRIVKE